ncbi:MAG TPA: mandelate racemase [Gammaproteobacteria bacterium]|nr:mandelate racemase [Gammaproteobacteria bacterium]
MASQPTLTAIRVRAASVPLPQPHQTASGVIAASPLVLVDITTSDGVTGHGLVFTYTPAALKPTAELVANLFPCVEGDPVAPLAVAQKLSQRCRLLGTQGLVGMALAGIDMAIWDALARTHNTSLVKLLGGEPHAINSYGGIGFDGELGSAAAAEAWVKKGFQAVKAKIGYPTVAEDLAVIRAMRAAVGEGVAIMVDYNQCLTPTDAMERMRVLDDEGLTWVEEPTLAHDYAGHARIAASCRTPIQSGENWWGPLDLQHAINARASDCIMPDVMKMGGVSGWIKASALAETHGLRVSSHLWPEVSAQLLCCTPTAHWLEYIDWWNPILAAPLEIRDGKAIVDDGAGTGMAWNEDAVARYTM